MNAYQAESVHMSICIFTKDFSSLVAYLTIKRIVEFYCGSADKMKPALAITPLYRLRLVLILTSANKCANTHVSFCANTYIGACESLLKFMCLTLKITS